METQSENWTGTTGYSCHFKEDDKQLQKQQVREMLSRFEPKEQQEELYTGSS